MEEFATHAASATPNAAVSSLTLLEARGVLARLSRSFPELNAALSMLEIDEGDFELWEPRSEDWYRAMTLAARQGLRGSDALQLAVYVRAKEKHGDLMLATSDTELIRACTEISVPVLNPGL